MMMEADSEHALPWYDSDMHEIALTCLMIYPWVHLTGPAVSRNVYTVALMF